MMSEALRLLKLMVLIWVLAPPGPAQARPAADLDLAEPGLDVTLLHGFPSVPPLRAAELERRSIGLEVHNESPRAHRLELAADGVSRTVSVAPGEEATVWLDLPATGSGLYHETTVTHLGTGAQDGAYTEHRQTGRQLQATCLHGLNLPAGVPSEGCLGRHMPKRWKHLAGFDLILARGDRLADEPLRTAVLRDWVLSGGVLWIQGGSEAQRQALEQALTALPHGRTEPVLRFGLGAVLFTAAPEIGQVWDPQHLGHPALRGPLHHAWVQDLEPLLQHHGAEGAVQDAHSFLRQEVPISSAWQLQEDLDLEYQAWLTAGGEFLVMLQREPALLSHLASGGEHVRRAFDSAEPPRLAFSTLLTLFAVLAGPVAWWLLIHRRSRPFTYLGVVTVLSLCTSSGLLLVALVPQGIRPVGSGARIRLIDQRAEVELELVQAAIFAPTSLGTGLVPPPDGMAGGGVFDNGYGACRDTCSTARNGICEDGAWKSQDNTCAEHTDCADCGTRGSSSPFDHDRLPSRTPSWAGLVRIGEPTGTLVVRHEGDNFRIDNQLGRDLDRVLLWLDGQQYTSGPIGAGRQATATPSSELRLPELPASLGGAMLTSWHGLLDDNSRDRYLAVGTPAHTLHGLLEGPLAIPSPEVVDEQGVPHHLDLTFGLL